MYVAWNTKSGPTLDEWMSFPQYVRDWILEDVGDRIDRHNGSFPDME